jgi:hypothetical protein
MRAAQEPLRDDRLQQVPWRHSEDCMMLSILTGLGLSERIAKIAGPAIIVLLAVVAVLAWGRHKYNQGVGDTDAKWELASEKLKVQAQQSATAADKPSVQRQVQFAEKVAVEKEKLDEAERKGSSPLDVLFGPAGVR